jgi:hypothetical protein
VLQDSIGVVLGLVERQVNFSINIIASLRAGSRAFLRTLLTTNLVLGYQCEDDDHQWLVSLAIPQDISKRM